jgi:endonuclease/exonuclease/phosphatase family metal-dependent hydrolase
MRRRLSPNRTRGRSLILLVLLFVGSLAALQSPTAGAGGRIGSDPAGVELNLMSFNIRYGTAKDGENAWEHRADFVFDVVRSEDPDLVGLQEALHFQIEEILEAVPQYAMLGVGRDDGHQSGEYSALLYRRTRFQVLDSGTFWFSDTPEVVASRSWGNRITRICTWARLRARNGPAFYVYNLHLDHQSQPSRERSVALLAQRIQERGHDDPVIVMGDLNAGEDNPAVRYLAGTLDAARLAETALASQPVPPSPRLIDTFRRIHPEAKQVGTFNAFEYGRVEGEKIDYIFVEPTVTVLDAAILRTSRDGRYPSDHFPVIARVRLPRQG